MYAGDLTPRDRAGPIVAVIAVHALLAFMLLTMSGTMVAPANDQSLELINLAPPVAAPKPPPPKPRDRASAPTRAAAPPAKRAEATLVVVPPAEVVLPVPSPIVAAATPGQGSAASQGAATAGTGSGAAGAGDGGGGGGPGGNGEGQGTHPRPLFRPLNPRGFPRDMVEFLPRGARVMIIFTVNLDGRVSDCTIRQSSGDPALDATVCQVAMQRFRYEPARRGDGTPYVAKSAYMQVF